MITKAEREKMRRCAPLLPEPGPEVVVQLLNELDEAHTLASKISRGCDCEYDYRCVRCDAVINLQAWSNG